MKNLYVQALTKTILAGTDVNVALDNLKLVLRRKGHQRLWSQILRATNRELAVSLKSNAPRVVVAKTGVVSPEIINTALVTLGTSLTPRVIIDETLVGGFTAHFKGKLLDKSYKRILVNLYRNITKS